MVIRSGVVKTACARRVLPRCTQQSLLSFLLLLCINFCICHYKVTTFTAPCTLGAIRVCTLGRMCVHYSVTGPFSRTHLQWLCSKKQIKKTPTHLLRATKQTNKQKHTQSTLKCISVNGLKIYGYCL